MWLFRPLIQRNEGNLRLLIGCFLLSSLMWVFNSLNKTMQVPLSIPLEIRYNKERFVPLIPVPKHLTATVRGYGWHILKNVSIHPVGPVVVWIKHPSLHSVLDTAAFRAYVNEHIEGITVKHVAIDTLHLPFDQKAKRWIHMKVDNRSISFAKGYRAENITLAPDIIEVSGPSSHLRSLADTLFISVPFKNIDKDFNETVRLSYFLHDRYLQVSHEKINVRFNVVQNKLAHGR